MYVCMKKSFVSEVIAFFVIKKKNNCHNYKS